MTLAEGIAGTEENFAEMMNKRAAELGMANSHFANARGKVDPSQHVTARDMARLAAYVIRNYPDYYHYFGEKEFTWNKIRQLNRNPLLTMDLGADGLKAGDVGDGGFALVGTAVQDGQRLIVVVNGLKSATERAEEARKLFDWGFHSFDRAFFSGLATRSGPPRSMAADPAKCRWSATGRSCFSFHARTAKAHRQDRLYRPSRGAGRGGQGSGAAEDLAGRHAGVDVPLKTGAAVPLGGLTQRAFDAGIELAGDVVRRALAKK